MSEGQAGERRRAPRYKIGQLVEVSFGRENFLQAEGMNISENGILCRTADAPDPGAHVFLMIEVRGEAPRRADGSPHIIEIEGFVARAEGSDGEYEVGIEFADIPDAETKRALHTMVQELGSR